MGLLLVGWEQLTASYLGYMRKLVDLEGAGFDACYFGNNRLLVTLY